MQAHISFGSGDVAAKSSGKVNVDIWYSSLYELQDARMDFSSLAQMQDVFKDKVVFQPRTYTYGCLWCSKKKKEEKCIFNGKYCPYEPRNKHKGAGNSSTTYSIMNPR